MHSLYVLSYLMGKIIRFDHFDIYSKIRNIIVFVVSIHFLLVILNIKANYARVHRTVTTMESITIMIIL